MKTCLLALGAGCQNAASSAGASAGVGQVTFSLQLGDGRRVDTVHYTLAAAGQSTLSGDIDVKASTRPTAVLAGIPAAKGYRLMLLATSSDNQVTCKAASNFDLAPQGAASLDLVLLCDPSDGGTPTLEVCSSLGDRWSSASSAPPRGSVSYAVAVVPGKTGRAPSLAWSVEPSSLGDVAVNARTAPGDGGVDGGADGGDAGGAPPSAGANQPVMATFTCKDSGPGTVRATLADGDCPPVVASFAVSCLGQDAGVGPGRKLNVCPMIAYYTANADVNDLPVGAPLSLMVSASDNDGDPIAVKWTTSPAGIGRLDNAATATATFVCQATGMATISVSAADARCADQRDPAFYVNCRAP